MKSDLGVMLPGGKTGVLLLHDVGGSAAEWRGQAQAFARAGFTVACPQLIGLGSTGASQGSAGMLVSEAEQALARLKSRCDSVTVVGIGYGGMLALELARHNAIAVQAVVMADARAWLPMLPFAPPAGLSGKIKQTWFAGLMAAGQRVWPAGNRPRSSPATLQNIARLLDSVHAGLPSIRQPVLLAQSASGLRSGVDGSCLLQRRLGGRVESFILDYDAQPGSYPVEWNADGLVDRSARFIANVLEEIETRRGNELRRKQNAVGGRTNAA